MGALKFLNTLRAKPLTATLFDMGDLSPQICCSIVRDYRSRYPMIPMFWKALDDAGRTAANGLNTAIGCLRFERGGDITRVWLPSGRALRYAHLRMEDTQRTIRYLDDWGEESEFTPDGPSLMYGHGTVLYGGKLCENVVQAVARDLLVEAVLRVEARGFHVLFHVHDEVIVEVESTRTDEAQRAVEEELSWAPTWAQGLPIGCEVKSAERYQK
jgi:DNA polymerase